MNVLLRRYKPLDSKDWKWAVVLHHNGHYKVCMFDSDKNKCKRELEYAKRNLRVLWKFGVPVKMSRSRGGQDFFRPIVGGGSDV